MRLLTVSLLAWPFLAGSLLSPPSFIPPRYAGSAFGDARHPKAPQKIPGRLECELFDVGGEGVAYHDSDGKNSGSGGLNPLDGTYLNGFRADEAVDISYTKDRGTPPPDFSEFNFVTRITIRSTSAGPRRGSGCTTQFSWRTRAATPWTYPVEAVAALRAEAARMVAERGEEWSA